VGTCEDLHYTYQADGFVKEYFDSNDRLVAAHTITDALSMNMECRSWTQYGAEIECRRPTTIADYLPDLHTLPQEWGPLGAALGS
jgi:hypothetical protein